MSATEVDTEQLIQAFAEIVNEQDYDRLPEVITDDFVWRTPAAPDGEVQGREATKEVIERMTGGFPDFHAEPGDVFVEGNEAMATVGFTGTHEGEFMDVPPTGEQFELVGATKTRVADGKLQEQHDVVNMQALLAQLGVAEG
ncbi:ester cyclase [Halorubellus sp. PRR65]|uniref:ester cyclase n=1 Tax=Halorubellus sp. PRR65 TaxID=3098148 RepID=UPI002B2594D8|nr:ester cyclase [Halorubellus sp. PRR65]